jgi:hypothetical protein
VAKRKGKTQRHHENRKKNSRQGQDQGSVLGGGIKRVKGFKRKRSAKLGTGETIESRWDIDIKSEGRR